MSPSPFPKRLNALAVAMPKHGDRQAFSVLVTDEDGKPV
jgi:hypothetical protein